LARSRASPACRPRWSGAIDIHQRHTLADVAEAEAAFIVKKLTGITLKGVALAPAIPATEAGPGLILPAPATAGFGQVGAA
jgi:hypothetical protein